MPQRFRHAPAPPACQAVDGIPGAPLTDDSPLDSLPLTGTGAVYTGVRAVLHGMGRLVRTPALWSPVAALAAIHAVLVGVAIYLGWSRGDDLVVMLVGPAQAGWWASLHLVLVFLARVALVFILVVTSWLLAGIFAGPLYDRLSARVETMQGTLPDDNAGLVQIAGDVLQGIRHTLYALFLYAAINVVLLVVLLVPVAGEAAWPIGSTLLSAVFLAREVYDYPTSRRRWSFRRKIQLLRGTPHLTLGLGLAMFGGLMVPGLNLFVMSAGVVGSTELFGRLMALTDVSDPEGVPPAG